jgi:hypothetical protein
LAKIYISYSHEDTKFATAVAATLTQRGHEPVSDVSAVMPGAEWRGVLNEALQTADAFVALLTESSLKSQFVLAEIGTARAIAQSRGDMLVIPVVVGTLTVPLVVADIHAVMSSDGNAEFIASEIDRALAALEARRAVKKLEEHAKSKQENEDVGNHVDVEISLLAKSERRDRFVGNLWFVAGIAMLAGGVYYGIDAPFACRKPFTKNRW